jgi:arylsulfatase A-like enzyme
VSNVESPGDRGWEELHVGSPGKGEPGFPPRSRWEAAFEEGETSERRRGQVLRPGWGSIQVYGSQPDTTPKGYEDLNDYRFVTSAIEALPGLAEGEAPWCLFVGPNGPHDPFIVPERYATMYDPADVALPASYRDTLEDKPRIYQRWRRQYWDQLSEEEVRESIAHYWGYCTMMDAMFGEVLDALEATGAAENTLVLRMSDHGEYCGAHGLYAKGVAAFREAYHIPLIARWPAAMPEGGQEVDALVNLLDFAPTFLDLAGVRDGPEEMAGRSLVPFLRGEEPEAWRDAHFTQFNGVELYYTQRAVQTRTHKYVYNGFDFDELYDLEADPHEMVNLAEEAGLRDVKRDLVRRMWETSLAEQDIISNPYWTVAMAPWGPAIALEDP